MQSTSAVWVTQPK